MKKRRQWTSKQKFQVILEGLKGEIEIGKLCNKYQISQGQYYKWRDQFIQHGSEAFDVNSKSKKEQKLEEDNRRLKHLIGELTIELKKSEFEL